MKKKATVLGLAISLVLAFLPATMMASERGKLFAQAREMVEIRDFEGALQVYEEILDRYPDDVEALVGKGKVLSFMGRFDEARSSFREALSVDPENLEASLGIADTWAWQNRYGRALSILRGLERKHPESKEVLIRLARYSLRAGEREEARYYARKTLDLYPGDSGAKEVLDELSAVYTFEGSLLYEFLNVTNDEDGQRISASLEHRPGKNYGYYGGFDAVDYFGEEEGGIFAGGSLRVTEKLEARGEVGLAPGASVLPRFSAFVELSSPAIPSWVVSGSFGAQTYRDADVYSFSVGGEYYPYSALSLSLRGVLSRTKFDRGSDSTDGSIFFQTTWFFSGEERIFLYAGYGNEAYRARRVDEVTDVHAKIAGAGGLFLLTPSVGVSPGFEFQERGRGTRYYLFSGRIFYRW